jgi:hypothetical protein
MKYCEEYGSMDACYDFPHHVSLSLTFCPTQRIPAKISGSHSSVWTTHWMFKYGPTKALTNANFYMILVLQLKPPLGVISL